MAKNFTICVGTLGMGLWRSPDGGMSWARGKLWKGYQGGRSVFGLAVHPKDPRVIYAGADDGIYRSEDRGANFEHIDSPLDGYKVWRIAIDPAGSEYDVCRNRAAGDLSLAGQRPALGEAPGGFFDGVHQRYDTPRDCPGGGSLRSQVRLGGSRSRRRPREPGRRRHLDASIRRAHGRARYS